jgi:hypothetical protein
VLLHPSRPHVGMKSTESQATQRARALPRPPLDISHACAGTSNPPLSTPHSRAQGPPNPPHGSTFRTRSKNCRQGSKKRYPPPSEMYQAARSPPRFEIITLLPPARSHRQQARRLKLSPAPSSDVVPHQVDSAMPKQPTAIRCRPSRH